METKFNLLNTYIQDHDLDMIKRYEDLSNHFKDDLNQFE